MITNDKSINQQLLNPLYAHQRTYWVQVDGAITDAALAKLRKGVSINVDGKIYLTKSAKLESLPDTIAVPDRKPPIRFRKSIPTSWVSIQITEGKNRQVRKMFAQVGFPVLRLIRAKLGKFSIQDMQPGDCLSLTASEVQEGFFR